MRRDDFNWLTHPKTHHTCEHAAAVRRRRMAYPLFQDTDAGALALAIGVLWVLSLVLS